MFTEHACSVNTRVHRTRDFLSFPRASFLALGSSRCRGHVRFQRAVPFAAVSGCPGAVFSEHVFAEHVFAADGLPVTEHDALASLCSACVRCLRAEDAEHTEHGGAGGARAKTPGKKIGS